MGQLEVYLGLCTRAAS